MLRPEIQAFAEGMQREIEANAHKGEFGSWVRCDPQTLLNETLYHVVKLGRAVLHEDEDAVEEFAADVANLSMMVRDAFKCRVDDTEGSK